MLHAVRLLGYGTSAEIAARFSLPTAVAEELLLDAEALGRVTQSRFSGTSGWSLTDRGRTADERLLASELGAAEEIVREVHAAFVPLNARFQESVTRWQIRPLPGDPLAANDHTDHRWDDRVLVDLRSVVAQTLPLCRRVSERLARFAGYDERLASAMGRADSGELSAIDGLRGNSRGRDSIHTVWFELHEDLIATLGISR